MTVLQKAEGPVLFEMEHLLYLCFQDMLQKFQLCFETNLLCVQVIGAGTLCAGLDLLGSLHQNICGGTDLILGLVDPDSSGGVACPCTQGALSIRFAPRGCSVFPICLEADRVGQLQVLSMEKQV